MSYTNNDLERIKEKFEHLKPLLNERSIRIWCATEAKAFGRGGKTLVHKATGISWPTILRGLSELETKSLDDSKRVRRKGGGRKPIAEKDSTILQDLDKL